MDYKQLEGSKIASLPIFKHFGEGEIKLNPQEWRKGEFGLFSILAIVATLFGGYMIWVYVLPILGALIQLAVVGFTALFLVMARKPIFKFFKNMTRTLHKAVIRHDPFGELEKQKEMMVDNKKKFHQAKGKISGLKTQMQVDADNQQKDAEKLQFTISALNTKSKDLLVTKAKVTDKESDAYIDLINEIETTVSQAERATYMYEQAKDFAIKYASRGKIMQNLDNKLKRVGNKIDIKIQDFDTTIIMLKNDYNFAEKSRQATDAAKSAMLFDKSWELDYAMDVITSTIASDISITQSNLSDIDMLTANFSIDDEAMFAKLDKIATSISSGDEKINTKKYKNPEYKLTSEDKLKSGGFGDIFQN